ncbi:hypothetical protein [Halorarius halobius]|uniref:hypothetical protein n=1 Tax=Halorarius halobius TaxID=2962671 RepID=UPI0020CF7C15|nr:hypothetical protein [Halorarius halobius]
MATLQLSTASNAPTVDPDRVDELREFLDEWLIGTGSFDDITVEVEIPERDPDTGEVDPPHLTLYGYASFSPAHRSAVRETVLEDLGDDLDEDEREVFIDDKTEELLWDYAGEHTEDFLRELSPFLAEPFVVQTVGYEKCRFPHVGYQYKVDTDGKIDHVQLG